MTTDRKYEDDRRALAWLTLALVGASLWIFRSYLHYLLVAAVLALATSHLYQALMQILSGCNPKSFLYRSRKFLTSLSLTLFFLVMIFFPLIFFVAKTYRQLTELDVQKVKATLLEIIDRSVAFLSEISFLQEPLERLKQEGMSYISGPALEVVFDGTKGVLAGVGNILIQIMWILLFYFLFNYYGKKILVFLADLIPTSYEHEKYLYRECTGTVAVVFYGTLFNMVAQGFAFGILMAFVGGYDAVYLGVLAGFCSVIPIVGAALVYVPVLALELLAGNWVNAIVILLFAWVVMGFFIDNILRMLFIGFLKRLFGFEYRMNEILILMAILAGISAFGFWGLIIGPSVLALALAAANLYSIDIKEDYSAGPGDDKS
jgi:predicted PurR-regulated permease PerM